MKKPLITATIAALTLTACSEAGRDTASEVEAMDAAVDSTENASGEMTAPNSTGQTATPASMPKLAYGYGLSFTLPSAEIGKLMRRHANTCEQQGPQSCRIVGMDLNGDAQSNDVHGKLQLAVAAHHARAVGALLEDEASDVGAKQTAATIGSEEVSKAIVDSEAHIRSREELRDRLTDVLRTRKGSLKDLVEAERKVAEVNEEIDQAKSWLAETKGRVAFSRIDIDYASVAGVGASFTDPIKGALGSLGRIVGTVIAGLILLLAVVLPIGGVVAGVAWLRRRLANPRTAP